MYVYIYLKKKLLFLVLFQSSSADHFNCKVDLSQCDSIQCKSHVFLHLFGEKYKPEPDLSGENDASAVLFYRVALVTWKVTQRLHFYPNRDLYLKRNCQDVNTLVSNYLFQYFKHLNICSWAMDPDEVSNSVILQG